MGAMGILKITGLCGVAVAVTLTACSGEPPPPMPESTVAMPPCCDKPPDVLIHNPRILDHAHIAILVRVLQVAQAASSEPPNFYYEHPTNPVNATLLVLKSWQGPFSAGRVLHVPRAPGECQGTYDTCPPFQFQPGDQGNEFLILGEPRNSNGTDVADEIFVHRFSVWHAAKSQTLMAALDQAVADSMPTNRDGYAARVQKELAALEDAKTKLETARLKGAPEGEIFDLQNQVFGHRENAARSQLMLQQLEDR
jgi:hypothetical protein